MTINDVNNWANIAPPVTQPKATPKKPEVTAPTKGGDVRDSAEAMSKAAGQRKSQSLNETSLDFSVDEASKRFVVQVTDKNTGELIRQLPGDAVLRIARQLESMKGVVFDQKF